LINVAIFDIKSRESERVFEIDYSFGSTIQFLFGILKRGASFATS